MNKIQEYFSKKCISNSLLGTLNNPYWIKWLRDNPDKEDDEKKYFRIGSALDCILTDSENWLNEFEVVDAVRPYGLMAKFVDNLPTGLTPMSPIQDYQVAYDKSGYKMKIERVIQSFWNKPETVNYYRLTRNISDDKTIISKDEFEIINHCKELIMVNPRVSAYFINTNPEHEELHHQVPIYFNYMDLECKALMDGIRINHKNKTIQPFDLKTTGKTVDNFPQSFWQFGYYRQAAFYTLALIHWIKSQEQWRKERLSEYTILPFQFIVVSKKLSSKFPALIFQCSQRDLEVGLNGGVVKETRTVCRGINELIDAYKWHVETDTWILPKWLEDTGGIVNLNIFE